MRRRRNGRRKISRLTPLVIIILFLIFMHFELASCNISPRYPIDWSLVPEKPTKRGNEQTSSFANCVCKRLFNQCTPNCCCDPDCHSLTLFTQCNMQQSRNIEDYRCVPKQVVVFKNLPENIKVKSWNQMSTTTPLFCVYYDSSSVKGTFYESLPDFTENDIKQAIDNDKKRYYRRTIRFSDVYDTTLSTDTSSSYMYGSTITVADKIASGVKVRPQNLLSIPTAIFSEQCEDTIPARFLQNIAKSNTCFRMVNDLKSACNTFLSTSPWTGGLYVSIRPGTASSTSISNYVTVNVRSIEKRSSGASVTLATLPDTQFVGSDCLDALQSIHYYVSYSPDGTIQAIDSDIVIEDITSGMVPSLYQMGYGITFLNGSLASSLDTGLVKENSGNPGYIQSSPIIAGLLASNDQKTKKAILQNIAGLQFFSGLTCDGAETQVIKFHEDAVTACRLQLSLSDLASLCTSNEVTAITEVESSADMIGRFGNADSNNVNDWVSIIAQDTPTTATWDGNTQTCYNLAAGLQYNFVIAKASSKQNEQWKVSGVKRNRFAQNWKFTATDPTVKQSFWIQFRAQFITLSSQDTVVRVSKAPNLLPTLPEDIFYPFSLFSSSPSLHSPRLIPAGMIAGTILLACLQLL